MQHDALTLEIGVDTEIEHGHVERLWIRWRSRGETELMGYIRRGGDGWGIQIAADQRGAEFTRAREDRIAMRSEHQQFLLREDVSLAQGEQVDARGEDG